MPEEIDKILEAEASIQNIADELTRMKDAATLLENAQNHNESVLNAAESVVNETKNLITTFREVVSNMDSLNISQRLSELENQVQKSSDFIQKQVEINNSAIATIDGKLVETSKLLTELTRKRGLFSRLKKRKNKPDS